MAADDMRTIVRAGYDAVADRYLAIARDDTRMAAWVERATADLVDGARVLDAGCGPGAQVAAMLARRFRVVGIDLSPAQIANARRLVPTATFEVADMASYEVPDGTLDAVICLFSLFHVPRIEQADVLARFARFLRPRGLLLVTFGVHDEAIGTESAWLGSDAPMAWSSFDEPTNLRLLDDAGFTIGTTSSFVDGDEWDNARHLLVEAEKR